MLTPVEDYHLTLKIELIKERGANILAQYNGYLDGIERVLEQANHLVVS